MKTIGEPLFARNANGTLKSRIGTLFLRTPGLVTSGGVHAVQRIAWTRALSEERVAGGGAALSESEAMAEWAESVDLLFTDDMVLVRPDPERMDLALKADEVLQTMVSKRRIRFLNTCSVKVRNALRARGENWRMSRPPQSAEEIVRAIRDAHVAIGCEKIYWYNPAMGTRWLTAGGMDRAMALKGEAFMAQIREITAGLKARNRLGQSEIALFPRTLDPAVAKQLAAVDAEGGNEAQVRSAVSAALVKWRLELPAALRQEGTDNFEWRAEMNATLTRTPNVTDVGERDLVQGISPEFYRQIEWLPGGRIESGELIFDSIFDEAQKGGDHELAELCDLRVRSILFNLMRLYGGVLEYVNIGRISRSLARHPVARARRGGVYIVQSKTSIDAEPRQDIIRFQKWGIVEHLDAGKDLLGAVLEAEDYADYILDRRLACRQLGMNLPPKIGFGRITEKYTGANQYFGTTVRAHYFVRAYVPGTASDKIPPERFRNPAFALAFAHLMGQAAALDMVVGRAATETGETMFDSNFEVVQCGPDGLPKAIVVTDHAGAFVKYMESFDELVGHYAHAVRRRESLVGDFAAFAKTYVAAFGRQLAAAQSAYRERRVAFDELFLHRPYDEAGSGAYRWARILRRLDACDPEAVAEKLKKAIQS